MVQLAKGIFYEDQYLGVTIGGLVFPHGTIYIDAPLRIEDARSWRASLMAQRSGSHRMLICLDSHPDRTLGARSLDCMIVSHQKTTQVFRNRPTIFKGQTIESGAAWEDYNEAIGLRWSVPDITFSQNLSLFWGGPEIIVEHHAGSSIGASWIIVPSEKIIYTGDSITVNQPPFLAGADITDWLDSLLLLQSEYKGFTIVGGRGGVATGETVRSMITGLKNCLKGMERLSKKHSSPEATETLIEGIMADFAVPSNLRDRYFLRLQYGLFQNYARRYRPTSSLEALHTEESDQ